LAIVAIIPARFASTRLPGKPLSLIAGRPMIQWVVERASLAHTVDRVLVATDDARIHEAVVRFGGEAVITKASHTSGTDRLAEAAATLEAEIVVNVQGDEPLLDPRAVDAVVEALLSDTHAAIATAAVRISSAEEMLRTEVVKFVSDQRGHALYFSRAPIPHNRMNPPASRASAEAAVAAGLALRHLGLYAYRKEALLRFAALSPSPLECAESLEQLRALHYGMPIRVVELASGGGPAVDTPDDLDRVRSILAGHSQE
jgi:3-deoxy-manno-octulosonate cytidylyltransferase (CMP-KDO synthetase)